MAKLSKEELMERINNLEISEDDKISLMEDITDSMEVVDNTEELDKLKADLEKAVEDYTSLQTKYKERFLSKEEVEEIAKDEESSSEEVEEEEVIDVKDIFTEEKEEEE